MGSMTPLAECLRPVRRYGPQPPDGYPVAPPPLRPRPCQGLPLLGADRGSQGSKGGIALLPEGGERPGLIPTSAQGKSRDPGAVMHEKLGQCGGKHRMIGGGDAGALNSNVITQTTPWHTGLCTPGFDAAPCPKSALSPAQNLVIVAAPATRHEASRPRRPPLPALSSAIPSGERD